VRVIGVVDLADGRAVHASGGHRERYAAVTAVAGSPIAAGDAVALGRSYTSRLGLRELYVADLDAIAGGPPQESLLAELTAVPGAVVWADAGVSSVERARHLVDLGAAKVVVGLETLRSFDALASICAAIGGERVAFSLDLRDGEPVTSPDFARPCIEPARRLARRAAEAGAGAVIVIDLARVGAGAGLDLETIAGVREETLRLTLLAGGGVRGAADLASLAHAGCDGALVATALLDGRLGAAEIAAAGRSGVRP